jgi:predicted nucleic acid-binding protein
MIVVSDTSPLNYLVLIRAEHLLPVLFQDVRIPPAVANELRNVDTPQLVRDWMEDRPSWLRIQAPVGRAPQLRLDAGEMEAISLAHELKANYLLIDEWDGREVAQQQGLQVVGTIGVLDQAAKRDLIVLPEMFDRLRNTSFRIDERLLQRLLDADVRRPRPPR